MPQMVINTPQGKRVVPPWSKCYCVTRHTPTYLHPYPFALPDGRELWLCPNTYHQANTLLGLYRKLNAPPTGEQLRQYTTFVKNLLKLYWQLVVNERESGETPYRWLDARREIEKAEEDEFNALVAEAIKVVQDGISGVSY